MKRKILMSVLIVVLAITMVACGGNNNGGNEGTAGTNTATENTGANNAAQEEAGNDEAATEDEAAPEEPQEMTIKHELGEATVKKNPEKVVVFDYGTLDTLKELGVEVAAVPQDSLPGYLSEYEDAKYLNAGTLFEPDFEKINELKPDVIFISGRTSAVYEDLNDIAPTVYSGVDTANYIESYSANLKMLGELFGKEAEVEAALSDLGTRVQALQSKIQATDVTGLIVLTTGGKVSAYGAGSRFGVLHDVFGVAQVDDKIEAGTHGMSISFEYIAEKNPDYLFVVDRDAVVEGGAQTAKEVIENDLVKNTNAYKNGNIVYLNPEYWYLSGGGLISVNEMLVEVEKAFE